MARHRDWLDGDDRHRFNDPNPDVWARFHHLACAAQHQPHKLRSALAAFTIELPDCEQLERAIERALSAVDVAEDSKATRDEYLGFIAGCGTRPTMTLCSSLRTGCRASTIRAVNSWSHRSWGLPRAPFPCPNRASSARSSRPRAG